MDGTPAHFYDGAKSLLDIFNRNLNAHRFM